MKSVPRRPERNTQAHTQLMKDSGWRWEVVALKSQRWFFIKLLSHFACFHEWIQCDCILKMLFKKYQHLWHCEDECMHLAQAWWHSFVGSASDKESLIRSWAETVHSLEMFRDQIWLGSDTFCTSLLREDSPFDSFFDHRIDNGLARRASSHHIDSS